MLLAVAGFAAQAQVRVTDSLLPQIASDFHTTVGAAAMVVTAYAFAHGSIQLVIGPVGDRFGKYRTVALMCAIGAVLVACCGLAGSLSQLMLARLATGAAAGWAAMNEYTNLGPAGRGAGGKPRQHQLRQRTGQAAARHQHGADRAHHGDGAVFAEAVADRADHQLDRAMGEGIGRHHHGGGAHGGVEVGSDLRQQRIGDAHLCLRGKARDREQHDRARRRSVRQRRGGLRGGCHVGALHYTGEGKGGRQR